MPLSDGLDTNSCKILDPPLCLYTQSVFRVLSVRAVFFNLFAAAEPDRGERIAHITPRIDPQIRLIPAGVVKAALEPLGQ